LVVSAIIIGLTLCAALFIVFYTLKNGIPPMPTTRYLCEQTAQIIKRYPLQAGQIAIEAGSGWGTLALYLAKRFPHLTFIGLENSPLPLLVSKWLRHLLLRPNCRFQLQNIYDYQYEQVHLVICYLFADAMTKLGITFREQLPKEAIVVSIFFAIPDWRPTEVIHCSDLYRTPIYIYRLDAQT
jgi:hypothetical protein